MQRRDGRDKGASGAAFAWQQKRGFVRIRAALFGEYSGSVAVWNTAVIDRTFFCTPPDGLGWVGGTLQGRGLCALRSALPLGAWRGFFYQRWRLCRRLRKRAKRSHSANRDKWSGLHRGKAEPKQKKATERGAAVRAQRGRTRPNVARRILHL